MSRAVSLHQAGKLNEAEAAYRAVLASDARHFDALTLLGTIHLQRGQQEEGVRLIGLSLEINPDQPMALNNRGNALIALKRPAEALAGFDRAVTIAPDVAELHNNRGNALHSLGRHAEALASYDQAITLNPRYADARNNRGNALHSLGRLAEALAGYDQAIALNPGHVEAHLGRGTALNGLGRYADALASFERVLSSRPDHIEALHGRGSALQKLDRAAEALAGYDRALALRPDHVEAHYNRAVALQTLNRQAEALAGYDRALALRPDYAEAHHNRGLALQHLKRPHEALQSFERVRALGRDYPYLAGSWLHCKMLCCDWEDFDESWGKLADAIANGETASLPFPILALPSTPAQQLRCAQIFVHDRHPADSTPLWRGERYAHDRIRVGYVSSDFRKHAMAFLIAEMIERHDRSRFEIIAFSHSPPSDAPIRRRLEKAFDRFLDVSTRSDHEIASLVRQMEIDITVDLNGYTANSRTGIFALRPAPIQVSHVGYPGTMGAPFIDYIIADATVIPPEHAPHYTEQVVRLPHTYWFNDSTKAISDRAFTRAELGLPENGFVFCCFNNNYKITPDLFDVWMRLLRAVPGSVLWLFMGEEIAAANLRREAERRGVAPERLVFAPRLEMPDHLARHRQADLFLDTFYYNAHTTASDALWAGLPVLTCLGRSFAGRVAASLLRAVGLPELVTHTHEEYEALALELATHPDKLAALREKLAANRTTQPLFDSGRFTRDIEKAYVMMQERWQQGLGAGPVTVDA